MIWYNREIAQWQKHRLIHEDHPVAAEMHEEVPVPPDDKTLKTATVMLVSLAAVVVLSFAAQLVASWVMDR